MSPPNDSAAASRERLSVTVGNDELELLGRATRAIASLLGERGSCVLLDCEPNGAFTRELEPLAEHIGVLARAVVDAGADLGIASDPDADRAAFVDHRGVPLGEEYMAAKLNILNGASSTAAVNAAITVIFFIRFSSLGWRTDSL